jgi:hypothetical protein
MLVSRFALDPAVSKREQLLAEVTAKEAEAAAIEKRMLAEAKGIADAHGRLMVVMVHNSDIPDGWEREAEDPQYFYKFSPDAYAVGINVVLYALTH